MRPSRALKGAQQAMTRGLRPQESLSTRTRRRRNGLRLTTPTRLVFEDQPSRPPDGAGAVTEGVASVSGELHCRFGVKVRSGVNL